MAFTPWWQQGPPPFDPGQPIPGAPPKGYDEPRPRGPAKPGPAAPPFYPPGAGGNADQFNRPQPIPETPQSMGSLPPKLQAGVETGQMPAQQALGMYQRFLGANPTAPGNQQPFWQAQSGGAGASMNAGHYVGQPPPGWTPPTTPTPWPNARPFTGLRPQQGSSAGQPGGGTPPAQTPYQGSPMSAQAQSSSGPVPGGNHQAVPVPSGGGHQNLPPAGGGPRTIPPPDNPGINSGPVPVVHPGLGPAGTVHHFQGVNVTLPNRQLTQPERDVLSGLAAGAPLGGPHAAAVYAQMLQDGIVDKPYPGYQAPPPSTPPPAPAPRPGAAPSNVVYTQNPVTQQQFTEAAAASAYRPMSTRQRWDRYNASQVKPKPATPTQEPPVTTTTKPLDEQQQGGGGKGRRLPKT